MASETTNYKLVKPDPEEFYDVEVQNSNLDKIDTELKEVNDDLNTHKNNKSNPHGVTKSQVGLGSVQNYGVATQAEAEAGTSSNKYMTPLRTKQAIDSLQAVKSVAGKTGNVTLTGTDIPQATTSARGSVQLNDTLTSTSTTQALTANQGKMLKDLVDGKATNADLTTLQQEVNEHLDEVASKTKYGHVKIGNGIDVSNGIISVSDVTASNVSIADVANNFDSTTVEGALSELFTNVSNGKSLIGGAITDVDSDVVIPTDPTFQDLADAIESISTGKKWASGVLTQQTTNQIHVVDGLDFKPSVIVGFSHQENFLNTSRSTIWFFYVNRSDYAEVSGNVQQSSFGWTVSTDSITINNNGFIINEKGNNSDMLSLPTQFTWVAFE